MMGEFIYNCGLSKIDYVFILPNENAIAQFCGREQVRLGDEIQAASQPPARDGLVSVGAGDEGVPSIDYSYSHPQGLYGGLALDGTLLQIKHTLNCEY